MPNALIPKGVVNVANAGTAVQLTSTPTPCMGIFIQAKHGNTGRIVGGDSTVLASLVSGNAGFILGAPSSATGTPPSITIAHSKKSYVLDTSSVWIDSTVNGDGVVWSIIAP